MAGVAVRRPLTRVYYGARLGAPYAPLGDMIMYDVEVTDTFGGEANYSWVNRFELDAPAGISRRALVRRAKRAAGWTGVRCARHFTDWGDTIALRPRGACLVMFITYRGV